MIDSIAVDDRIDRVCDRRKTSAKSTIPPTVQRLLRLFGRRTPDA
jgi:endonuclease III